MNQHDQAEFAQRRYQILDWMAPDSIAIVKAASMTVRNNDVHYPFHQNSDFYYLTGLQEPDAVALLICDNKAGQFVLFIDEADAKKARWEGPSVSLAGAMDDYGADQAFALPDLSTQLTKLLANKHTLYYTFGEHAELDTVIIATMTQLRQQARRGKNPPTAIIRLDEQLASMRLQKSPWEIEQMRKAVQITVAGHKRAMQVCQPGMMEYQIEAELLHEFIQHGARSVAYPMIVGAGPNACILHYTNNNSPCRDGDLLLIDAGAQWQQYAADVTRTFPINGHFTKEQHAIYDIVLRAQQAAIAQIKPGVAWSALQKVIVEIITEGLLELGILRGKRAKCIEKKAYEPFYMHTSGHWLGLDVHDVGRYKDKDQSMLLAPGMVLTVEPGIYISSDQKDVAQKWHDIAVRIEDDVLVTDSGHEVLSCALPSGPDEIEALMARAMGE